jgi:hypothetical protein
MKAALLPLRLNELLGAPFPNSTGKSIFAHLLMGIHQMV